MICQHCEVYCVDPFGSTNRPAFFLLHAPLLPAADRYIKADMYRYRFTKLGSEESKKGQVWTRQLIGSFWGATSRDGLIEAISSA